MFDLSGHRALVTGGGRGVGLGIAHCLAERGAAVAVNDVVADRAAQGARSLRDSGATACASVFDITDRSAVEAGVADVAEQLGGPVDILVNNAGPPADMGLVQFRDMDPGDWERYVDLNLYGSLHCIRAVLDPMVDAGWGRIVQISSGAARTGVAFGVSMYGASKSAIEGFVRHLSQELAPTGVTVNALALGLLHSALPQGSEESAVRSLAASVPVGRLGEPDDVGAAVVYLASEEAAWLTGQTIGLNGGATTN